MTGTMKIELQAKFEAILHEPLTVGFDVERQCGVLSIVRANRDGDVQYVPIADISLISAGPVEES